jgi:N-acetylglucosaminyl-diphospho-decaprenol L-rhamnosyltransferase
VPSKIRVALRATVEALIISYNTMSELQVTLQSLFDHPPTEADLRVSVLDNGSVDGSAEMVQTLFPSVRLTRSPENLGFARANNLLAECSTADYLLLLNSDVIIEQDIISPMIRVLVERPEVIAAGPKLRGTDGRVQNSAHRLPTMAYEFAAVIRGKRVGKLLKPIFDSQAIVDATDDAALIGEEDPRDPEFLWATCWMLRRNDVRAGNLFSPLFPMYDEDLDFCRRAAEDGRKLCYLPSLELTHIGGASTGSSLKKLRLMRRARHRYYAVHHGPVAANAYRTLVPVVAWIAVTVQRLPFTTVLRAVRARPS